VRGELFARGSQFAAARDAQKVSDDLHRKIGRHAGERDFLAGSRHLRVLRGGVSRRKAGLSVKQASALLGLRAASF